VRSQRLVRPNGIYIQILLFLNRGVMLQIKLY